MADDKTSKQTKKNMLEDLRDDVVSIKCRKLTKQTNAVIG